MELSKEQKENRIVIASRGIGRNSYFKFIDDLFQAFEDGYRPTKPDARWLIDVPKFKRVYREVALYKEGYEVPAPTVSVVDQVDAIQDESIIAAVDAELQAEIDAEKEEQGTEATEDSVGEDTSKLSIQEKIEATTTKKDLLVLAAEMEVEVPEKVKQPKAIQKLLLESLN